MAVGDDAHIAARCDQNHAANGVKSVQVECVREVDMRGDSILESVDVNNVVIGCGFDCLDDLGMGVCGDR